MNQRSSRRLGAHKRDIHPIRAFPCRPAERMPLHQTRRHTAELDLTPDDLTLGAGIRKRTLNAGRRSHTKAPPMKGVHPIFWPDGNATNPPIEEVGPTHCFRGSIPTPSRASARLPFAGFRQPPRTYPC